MRLHHRMPNTEHRLTTLPPSAGVKMKEVRTSLHCSCFGSVHVSERFVLDMYTWTSKLKQSLF